MLKLFGWGSKLVEVWALGFQVSWSSGRDLDARIRRFGILCWLALVVLIDFTDALWAMLDYGGRPKRF